MCNVWQNPSIPGEEINLITLAKIPSGIDNLNITGGEPTLRKDLEGIVEVLYPKAKKLEISSNGLHPEKLESIIKKHPDIKIRFSLEGREEVNDRVRGEVRGYETKVSGMKKLKEIGGCDLGFAMTIQDDNVGELLRIYRMANEMGLELATSTLHNGYQFHKNDNYPYDRVIIAKAIEALIYEMLKSSSVKDWFRAYMNLGLIEKTLGRRRLTPCSAGTDFVFMDPWADIYGCNVRPDLKMGNLATQEWDEVYKGEKAQETRRLVGDCKQNCWMVGSARTAMRNTSISILPKFKPLWWVLTQKARLALGKVALYHQFIDYIATTRLLSGTRRINYLEHAPVKRKIQRKSDIHYIPFGPFENQ